MSAIVDAGTDVFSQLFHASDAGLALVDSRGLILEANAAFISLIGKNPTGDPVSTLLPQGSVTGRDICPPEWRFGEIKITCKPLADGTSVLTALPNAATNEAGRIQSLEDSLSLAMQGGKLGWWTRDLRTGKVEWSAELEAIFGLQPGTFAKSEAAFFDLILEEDRPIVAKVVEESIRTGNDYRMEFRFHRADGSVGWMEGRGRTVHDSSGKPLYLAGMGIDITDQHLASQALAESEGRYKHLVEIMPAGVCTCGKDGYINFYNLGAEKIWGRTPQIPSPDERFCGSFRLYTTDGNPIEGDAHPVAIALRTGMSFRGVEARVERPDGSSVFVEVNIDPVRDATGVIVGAINVFLDVNQRRHATEELQILIEAARNLGSTLDLPEIYDRLQALVATALECDNMVVSSFNPEDEMVSCVYAWMEGSRADVSVFPAVKLAPEGRGMQSQVIRSGESLLVEDALEGRKNCTTSVIIDADGTVSDTQNPEKPETRSIVMAPIKLEGKVTGVVQVMSNRVNAFSQDQLRLLEGIVQQMAVSVQNARLYAGAQREIAERRKLESELERRVIDRTAALEAANKEMEGFTYSVSHDLRAPLRAIISAAMILLEDHGDQVNTFAREELIRMANAASKLGRVIDDLLGYSRLNRAGIERRSLDFSALAHEVADTIATRHAKPMVVEVEDGLTAKADPLLLRLALENLLDNAYKYSLPDGGHIWIGASPSSDLNAQGSTLNAFFVRDNGIGFDPQYAHKIFLPFERLVADTAYPGTGIGLANVRRIMQKHGGKVWAESTPGNGATFYFTLEG